MVLYSTKSGSWLVIIVEPLLVLYSTIVFRVYYYLEFGGDFINSNFLLQGIH